MLLPTIPAPMTTTLARSGSAPMCVPSSCAPAPPAASLSLGRQDRAGWLDRCSGEVDDDGLELGQALDEVAPADPAEPALGARATAEREVRLPVVRALVDVDPSGPDRFGEAEADLEVAGEDRGEEAECRRVDDPDRLVQAADPRDRRDRPEGLLAGDVHGGPYAADDRRLEVERAAELRAAGAAGHDGGAAGGRLGDVLLGLGGGLLVVQRADRRQRIERVAEAGLAPDGAR